MIGPLQYGQWKSFRPKIRTIDSCSHSAGLRLLESLGPKDFCWDQLHIVHRHIVNSILTVTFRNTVTQKSKHLLSDPKKSH